MSDLSVGMQLVPPHQFEMLTTSRLPTPSNFRHKMHVQGISWISKLAVSSIQSTRGGDNGVIDLALANQIAWFCSAKVYQYELWSNKNYVHTRSIFNWSQSSNKIALQPSCW